MIKAWASASSQKYFYKNNSNEDFKWKCRLRTLKHNAKRLGYAPPDINLEQFKIRLANQNGLCLICKINSALCVDHDHVTGRVRGILCRNCNQAIGLLQDSSIICFAAGEYLE
jgi:hypothetical protein